MIARYDLIALRLTLSDPQDWSSSIVQGQEEAINGMLYLGIRDK